MQDDRPYLCPYCSKSFKTLVSCKKHIKTHRGGGLHSSGRPVLPLKAKKSLPVIQVISAYISKLFFPS